jgi:hypothetical protein
LDAEISRRVRAFDVSGEWAVDGARGAAAWLASWCRLATLPARREVKVARQVRALPQVDAAWRAGTVTTGHVEVLARARHAARANERFDAFEPHWLAVAEARAPEDLEQVARQWRDALDAQRQDMTSLAEQRYESRQLDVAELLDGMVVLGGRADGEAGAYIRRAIDVAYAKAHQEHDPRTPGQQRIDALTTICKQYLDGQPARSNRPHVLFLADLPTVTGDVVGTCETDRGVRVSPETVRRIACDAFVSTALVDTRSAVLDLGRAVRTFTPEQYRAILVQYPTCAGPGCAVPASDCEMHHLERWEHGGPTDLGNGIPLCWHDHHLVHEQRWRPHEIPSPGPSTGPGPTAPPPA